MKSSNYDHLVMGQTDLHNVSLIRTNADGHVMQSYAPAQTEAVLKDNGDLERAPNGQPLRITTEIGDVSINRTRTTESGAEAFNDRMVLRTLDGEVKGIVEMDVKLKGGSGSNATDIESIDTTARPVALK
ncbi:hypothetical protein KBI23_26755 [bacterium]|nr:hypothetical protein [bacterium]MBP9811322.1 hypothetical protein [bacterium]